MTIQYVTINNKKYTYYSPTSYTNYKLLLKQIKRVEEKIRACENGCYAGKVSKSKKPYYQDYPELLFFLETLLNK